MIDADLYEPYQKKLSSKLTIHQGCLFHCQNIVESIEAKQSLFKKHAALACDMESYAIAEVANKVGIPFITIRAIIDTADMTLPKIATNSISDAGNLKPSKFIIELIRHPNEWADLLRLAKNSRAAQRSLSSCSQALTPPL